MLGERPTIRVDSERNLLFITGQGGMLVFDRLASGNARPKAILAGPRSGHQFELYSPAGMIVTHRSGALEGWSIEEGLRQAQQQNGTAMMRPLWSIATPKMAPERMAGTGIALDPVHRSAAYGEAPGAALQASTLHTSPR